MNATFCSSCGLSNYAGANFCTDCGHSFTGAMPSASPMSVISSGSDRLQPGQVMNGQYTIVGPLGKGGMGMVYLAQETIANKSRNVVIKEMLIYYDPSDLKAKVKAGQRFETEAATLVALNFASIPQIFDYFSESGRNYIVMQHIEGRNLEKGVTHTDDNKHLVPGQPYPVEKVLRWGIQVCRVLENLAKQNVVHQDIKPANLIEDNSGNVWLVDFGTAKAQRSKQRGDQVGLQKSSVYGTVGYAPPEQYNGQAEPRSDVYALAATLYHLLTDDDPGKKPFCFSQLSNVSSEIRSVLKEALEGKVEQRITATEFRQLLERVTTTEVLFYWQDGTISRQPQALVQPADQQWEEAKVYFTDGRWEKWFNDLHRNDILAQLKRSKHKYRDDDIALDAFLRLLDPAFPLPSLQTNLSALDFGDVAWQEKQTQNLELRNVGGGCLHGQIRCASTWVQISQLEFVLHKQTTIKVTVNANKLTPRAQAYTANLLIDAGNGGQEQIPITIMVPEPNLAITTDQLNFGSSYPGKILTETFSICNQGGAPFAGKIECDASWVNIEPTNFDCLPSKKIEIQVKLNTNETRISQNRTEIRVQAQAGGWEQAQEVTVLLNLSIWKTLGYRSLRLIRYLLREFGTLFVRYPIQAITLSLLVPLLLSTLYWDRKETKCYNVAEILAIGGSYGQAAIAFEQCSPYWPHDAPERALEMHYEAGLTYLTAHKWEDAIAAFERVGNYQDGPEMINGIHYQLGTEYLKEEEWKKAVAEFEKITYDKETPDMSNKVHYQVGKAYLAAKQSEKAVSEFKQAGSYKDAPEMVKDVPYQLGVEYFKEGEWEKAVAEFERAGNYKDAPDMIDEVHYQAGLAYLEDERWKDALTAFKQAGEYKNTPDIINDMYYQAGLTFLAQQEWEKAIVEFEQAGEYKDVPDKLLQTHRKAYQAYLAAGENKAVEREFHWLNQWHVVDRFKKHTSSVLSVAFSLDGMLLASGSSDETIQLWDMKDRTPLHTLVGHTGNVWSLAFSPNDTLLASGSGDKKILLWHVESGEMRSSLEGHTAGVSSAAFSSNGSVLASGSWDNTIQLWDVFNSWRINTWHGHTDIVRNVIFSPDGRVVASGSKDGSVRLWYLSNGELMHILKGHTNGVNSVAFSPNGELLAVGSNDNTVRLWHVEYGELVDTLEGHAQAVNGVVFSPNGTMLASGSDDGRVRLWNVADGELVQTLKGHTDGVNSVVFSPDGMMLASGSDDGTVRLWELGIGDE